MRRKLRNYQKKGYRFLTKHDYAALFWEMRLGKTLVVIRALHKLNSKNNLIVAPYSALLSWEEELQKEKKSYLLLSGRVEDTVMKTKTKMGRRSMLEQFYDYYTYILISKECFLHLPEIANFYWSAVVIDESHNIANGTKMSKFYINNFRDSKYRYILSGTPAPTGELDYFRQILFLDENAWGTRNFYQFRFNNFLNFFYKWYLKYDKKEKFSKVINKYSNILSRKDVNLNCEMIEETRIINFSKKIQKIYDTIEKEFCIELEEQIENETIWAPVKYKWLRRLCGGFADKKFISNVKIIELYNLLKTQFKNDQTVIFCLFIKEIEQIQKFLKKKKFRSAVIQGGVLQKKRKEILGDFRKGKIQHLICQHSAVKEGANLSNCDVEIFYSLPDGALTFSQVKDRFLTVDKSGSKLMIYLLIENTMEKTLLKNLKNKNDKQESFKEYLKEMRKKHEK